MNFAIGDKVGDYQVIGELGAGGMGKVYKVKNLISERVEAMKVLLPNLEGAQEVADRFLREIKVLASLDHPNIAALRTALKVENQLLMIMEYVEGVSLEEKVHQGPVPVGEALGYISQILDALSYAHARGVIHRDIKPGNMILTPSGTVKLMDFGIARAATDPRLTASGATVGSLYYMSPEQVRGEALDARSDLYAVGVSLYELVTGKHPFEGTSDYAIMAGHLEKAPVPPIQVDPQLPPALNEIILMAIAKDPASRFQSAAAFRKALDSVGQAPSPVPTVFAVPQAATAPAPPPAVVAPAKSHRGLYMLMGAVLAIAILILAATQVPRWYRTLAGDKPASVPATTPAPVPASVPETPPTPAPAAADVAPAPAPAPTTAPAPAAAPAPAPRPVSRPPAPVQAATEQPAPPPPVATPVPAPQAPPAQPAPVSSAALDQVREQLLLVGTRANVLRKSMDTMEQMQNRGGLSMRADMKTARGLMEAYLDQAEAALNARDVTGARTNLDKAEAQLSKLEGWMNIR